MLSIAGEGPSRFRSARPARGTVELRDSNGNVLSGRSVSWSTGNQAIATVSGPGPVTGAGAGSTTVAVTSESRPGSASLQVLSVPVASITVTLSRATIEKGATTQATAVARDADGTAFPSAWP